MKTPVLIRLILNTEKEKNARTILARLKPMFETTSSDLAPYHKGGMEASIVTHVNDANWPTTIFNVIDLAQRIGSGWHLSGCVQETIELIANDRFSIAGIEFAHIRCDCPTERRVG